MAALIDYCNSAVPVRAFAQQLFSKGLRSVNIIHTPIMQQRQQPSHRPRPQGFIPHNKRAVVGSTAGTVPPAWRTSVAQVRPTYYDRRKGGDVDFGQQGEPHARRDPRPAVGSKILMSQLPLETVHERDIEVRQLPYSVHRLTPFAD